MYLTTSLSVLILLVLIALSESLRIPTNHALTSSVRNVRIASSNINQLQKFSQLQATKNDNSGNYWEGDWICADCGYVYDREIDGGGLYFEELKKGFVCPQCQAPRKRYAKKVGDQWGVTRDGGDFPIYAVTLFGLVVTAWFALVYVPSL